MKIILIIIVGQETGISCFDIVEMGDLTDPICIHKRPKHKASLLLQEIDQKSRLGFLKAPLSMII